MGTLWSRDLEWLERPRAKSGVAPIAWRRSERSRSRRDRAQIDRLVSAAFYYDLRPASLRPPKPSSSRLEPSRV